jgi:hypothetical protein
VMQGGEHDEAISIYALLMLARKLLRRHRPSPLSPALTPRNDGAADSTEGRQASLRGARHGGTENVPKHVNDHLISGHAIDYFTRALRL